MSQRRFAASWSLLCALGVAMVAQPGCTTPPDISPEPSRSPPPGACHDGHQSGLSVTVCEVTDPAWLLDFRTGRWLPPAAAALRSRSHLAYGRAESAAEETASQLAKHRGSYISAHFDMQHPVAGWDIYDVDARVAIVSVDIDGRWAVAYSQDAATSDHDVLDALDSFLADPEPVALRAMALDR